MVGKVRHIIVQRLMCPDSGLLTELVDELRVLQSARSVPSRSLEQLDIFGVETADGRQTPINNHEPILVRQREAGCG